MSRSGPRISRVDAVSGAFCDVIVGRGYSARGRDGVVGASIVGCNSLRARMRFVLVRTASTSWGMSASGGRPVTSDTPSRMNGVSAPLSSAWIAVPSMTVPSLIHTRTAPPGRAAVTSASDATRSIANSFFSPVASTTIGSPNFSINPRTTSPLRSTTSSESPACGAIFVG